MKTAPQTIAIGSRETRKLTSPIEIRMDDPGDDAVAPVKTIRGYAAKFNTESENLGSSEYQFYETIAPGAFDDVLGDDVRALFNHEPDLILARSKAGQGTLKIGVDTVGLWYEFEAPNTQLGRDLVVSLERGDIDQSSFSFSVDRDGQSWSEVRDGDGPTIVRRTITKVSRLYDVSPVTFPAYLATEVDCRALASEFIKETTSTSSEEDSRRAWAAFYGFKTPRPEQ